MTTVKEHIFEAYSNLAMAHSAVSNGQEKYGVLNYSVRAKMRKGLREGTMNIRSFFPDEKVKLENGSKCNYCGSEKRLSLEHIFPKKWGGEDTGDNLIYACQSCNSSKKDHDLMEWAASKGHFLPLMVIRRYLKLVYFYCLENDLLEHDLEEVNAMSLPFELMYLPLKYPAPNTLMITT